MKKFAFDLDGTVTKVETLPLLAEELDLAEEMKLLTDLTLSGKIPFAKSFRMRYLILRNIPLQRIQEIMDGVELDEKNIPVLKKILDKGTAIRELKKGGDKVIAIGESFNDVPMFEEANTSVAYGGVHKPVSAAISVSDYVVFDGGALCRLLKML